MKKHLLTLFILIALPLSAHAASTADLLAQIQSLMKIVQELQAQLAALNGEETPPTIATNYCAPTGTKFGVGHHSSEVINLQKFLKTTGDFTYPEFTTYYGSVTKAAVQKYQCREMSICSGSPSENGYGLAGPGTRKVMCSTPRIPTPPEDGETPGLPKDEPPHIPPPPGGGGGGSTYDSCTLDGVKLDHKESMTFFNTATVSSPKSCQEYAAVRTCNDGTLKGDAAYRYVSCRVVDPVLPSCSLTADNTSVTQGDSLTLSWQSSNTTGAQLSNSLGLSVAVSPEGSRTANTADVPLGDINYALTVTNSAGTSAQCTEVVTVIEAPEDREDFASCDFYGETIPHGESVSAYKRSVVQPGGSCAMQQRVCNDGVLSGSYPATSCVVSKKDQLFGINFDPLWQTTKGSDREGVIARLDELGVGTFRMQIRWVALYDRPDVACVDEALKPWVLNAYKEVIDAIPEDIDIVVSIESPSPSCKDLYEQDPEAFSEKYQEVIATIVKAYGYRVQHWQVWNEKNNSVFYVKAPAPKNTWTPADFVKHVALPGYKTIKRIQPEAVVVGPSTVFNGVVGHHDREPQPPMAWLDPEENEGKLWYVYPDWLVGEYAYLQGQRAFDTVSTQPYYQGIPGTEIHEITLPTEQTYGQNGTLSVMQQYGDAQTPIWWTEFGELLWKDKSTEAQQAQRTIEIYERALEHRNNSQGPLERAILFALRDNAELNKGLGVINVETNEPRPVFYALKEFIANHTNGTKSCAFNGTTVAHGSSVSAYKASTVPEGQSCIKQMRTCTNGVLSGSYTHTSCSVMANERRQFLGVQQDIGWGVYGDTQAEKDADLATLVTKIEDLGVGHVRILLRWLALYDRPGETCEEMTLKTHVLEDYQEAIATLPSGVSISAVLDTPPQACKELYMESPQRFSAEYARYVSEVVTALKDDIDTWQLWIEPNANAYYLGDDEGTPWTAADYVNYVLKPGYLAAKQADPSALVGSAGTVYNGVYGHIDRAPQPPQWWAIANGVERKWFVIPNFLEGMYQAGAKNYMDFVNIHPFFTIKYPASFGITNPDGYTATEHAVVEPLRQTDGARAVMQQYGDASKPIWWTPIAAPINDIGSESGQASYLMEYIEDAYAQRNAAVGPIKQVLIYTLRDIPTYKNAAGDVWEYGLLDVNNQERKVFDELKDFINQ